MQTSSLRGAVWGLWLSLVLYGSSFGVEGEQPGVTVAVGTNLPGAEFPRVEPDGRVSFQLRAPDARRVTLEGGEGLVATPLEMTRGDDGVWRATTPLPADIGFHYCWYTVDGLRVNDPSTYTYFGWGRETSGVEVPSSGEDFHHFHPDAEAGCVSELWYASEITGKLRRAFVYLPAAYAREQEARYPVLYLLHGAGESERSWVEQGRLQFIMDHLINAGSARPMIVVADSGYAAFPAAASAGDRQAATAAFEAVLLQELVPLIDRRFRTHADAAHRALAGLSMGGGQALAIGLSHPEHFAWIAAMSAPRREGFDIATAYDGVFTDVEAFTKSCRLVWLGAGTREESFHAAASGMHAALTAAGVPSVFYASVGTGHEWHTWRRSLRDLAGRLFQGD